MLQNTQQMEKFSLKKHTHYTLLNENIFGKYVGKEKYANKSFYQFLLDMEYVDMTESLMLQHALCSFILLGMLYCFPETFLVLSIMFSCVCMYMVFYIHTTKVSIAYIDSVHSLRFVYCNRLVRVMISCWYASIIVTLFIYNDYPIAFLWLANWILIRSLILKFSETFNKDYCNALFDKMKNREIQPYGDIVTIFEPKTDGKGGKNKVSVIQGQSLFYK